MKRIAIVVTSIAIAIVATHTHVYGAPRSAPSGASVEIASLCAGYTWSNGKLGQTGFWVGCDQ